MEIFKQLKKLGYKHYIDLTIDELDALSNDSIEKRIEYSLVIDWFREEYELHLLIYRLNDNWVWQIFDIERNCYITEMTVGFSEIKRSYEECRDQIILKAIELCQNKK